jgi:hypothetical protein
MQIESFKVLIEEHELEFASVSTINVATSISVDVSAKTPL